MNNQPKASIGSCVETVNEQVQRIQTLAIAKNAKKKA